MNEKPISNFPQTPEAVAYQLMLLVLQAEKSIADDKKNLEMRLTPSSLFFNQQITGNYILNTYAECLKVVNSNCGHSKANDFKSNT